jgi:hypothetical protein
MGRGQQGSVRGRKGGSRWPAPPAHLVERQRDRDAVIDGVRAGAPSDAGARCTTVLHDCVELPVRAVGSPRRSGSVGGHARRSGEHLGIGSGPAQRAAASRAAMTRAPGTTAILSRLADLEPTTLALMHGSSFTGDGALRELAVQLDARFPASA